MNVRLSDVATGHIDDLVAEGAFESRAQYLSWLVEREAQRKQAWLDILKMKAEGSLRNPETEAILKATSRHSLAHLD